MEKGEENGIAGVQAEACIDFSTQHCARAHRELAAAPCTLCLILHRDSSHQMSVRRF